MFEEQNQNLEKKKKLITIAGVLAVVAIIVFAVVSKILSAPKKIKIQNYDQYLSSAPADKKEMLERHLYTFLSSKLELKEDVNDAYIRENTVKIANDGAYSNSATFLIDIDSLRQTYVISFSWMEIQDSNNLDDIIVACSSKKQTKYPESVCEGMYDGQLLNISWKNEYQLKYTFSSTSSIKIQNALRDFMLDDESIVATKWDYEVRINEASIKRIKEYDNAYYFEINFDNVNTYEVTVRMDQSFGKKYIAIFAESESDGRELAKLYLYDKSYKEELSDWFIEISDNEKIKIDIEGN